MAELSAEGAIAPEDAREVHLVFTSASVFVDEYARNLTKGGAFVATEERFELRELVRVVVELPFADEQLTLGAEIVHSGPGGVAVQFLDDAPELRERFEPLLELARERVASEPDEDPNESTTSSLAAGILGTDDDGFGEDLLGDDDEVDDLDDVDLDGLSLGDDDAVVDLSSPDLAPLEGLEPTSLSADDPVGSEPAEDDVDPNEQTFTARARRAPARVPARVQAPTGKQLRARTRDVSKSGVLLSVDGEELPVGREVSINLVHPGTGEGLDVTGQVVRHVEGEGAVPAVAIKLANDQALQEKVEQFVREVHQVDEDQRVQGIRGPLEELGAVSMLQMFSALAPRGTLLVSSGVEEGIVAFEDNVLLYAEVGSVEGVKALARILSWRDGFFEFRAALDPVAAPTSAEPIEGAILEALRMIDEGNRISGAQLSPATRFEVHQDRLGDVDGALDKSEEAVLDLAAAGFTVRRILDVIPDNDAQIHAAILSLLERGLISQARS